MLCASVFKPVIQSISSLSDGVLLNSVNTQIRLADLILGQVGLSDVKTMGVNDASALYIISTDSKMR